MFKSIRWKVVVSLLITASIPIGASIYFFERGIVRAYSVALNRDVEEALRLSVDSQREVFNLWKKNFRSLAVMHAGQRPLLEAVESKDAGRIGGALSTFLDEEPSLLRAAVVGESDEDLASRSRDLAMYPDEKWRKLEVTAPLAVAEGRAGLVELYVVPWKAFHDFETSGKTLRTFQTSLKTKENITGLYKKMYIALVGCSVLFALLLSYLYTRGFSKRIKKIAGAASEVGKGNLEIQVNDTSGDEVGQLGRNFDKMVVELKESRERISYLQKISAWQEIARRLAHEIKNPLTPIQLSVQQMRSKYTGGDESYRRILEESTQIVEEEIESLRKLVTEFSGFARLPGVNPKPCSLNETLREILGGMEAVCKEKGVALEITLPPRDAHVRLDRLMFKRAMDNLIMNALEAVERAAEGRTGAGAPGRVLVRIGVERERGVAAIEIMDSGEGIRQEDREMIFLPYFTKRKGGTGLGLAIVKKIVLEHGGEIELVEGERPPLPGACFMIELPIA
jgi:two-component system nitrogen regulation sensor histidine kinase NtrY